MDGIFLGHNLLLSQAFSVGIPRWMGFRLSESPSHELFSFFTMEFWLSRSLSHELFLFSRWNFGYHEAFLTNFFFSHDGIPAITKPFSRTFSFFTMEFRLSRSLSHEFFLFSRWNSRNRKYETCNLGEDSFHIYIGKSIYTGPASLKTLPLDLEPPLQGKEYGPSYSRTTIKT
jgi:hypothetical protein